MPQTFSFTVDGPYNKEHNEMFRDARRLKLSALLFGLIFFGLALGVVYFSNQASWSYYAAIAFGVIGLISLVLIPVLDKQVGTAQSLYDRYELVPAMIAQINPRDKVILALVNTSVNPNAKPVWALAARTVTRLEGHSSTVGERVPAVAVSGRRSVQDQEHWDEISPMPIAWGTPDPDVVRDAINAIDQKRWRRLEQHLNKVDDVLATKFNLLEL
ncbi:MULTISPECIES: DUF3239 domain-containing protein [Corynebacterium]|uniref:DUF3239 domain-containing protein n=1 Tax=Corynebacterium TaxID=1716 RepID=UPI001CEF5D11|nr:MULTISPECIES: DUF3239 domain-containing protein [Corynebacterium]